MLRFFVFLFKKIQVFVSFIEKNFVLLPDSYYSEKKINIAFTPNKNNYKN